MTCLVARSPGYFGAPAFLRIGGNVTLRIPAVFAIPAESGDTTENSFSLNLTFLFQRPLSWLGGSDCKGSVAVGEAARHLVLMKRRAEQEHEDRAGGEETTDLSAVVELPRCPYLDTVNRAALDFDMSPTCSVSLSRLNVYGCLVCGRFFQGRGRSTHAYTHALQAAHFVFVS